MKRKRDSEAEPPCPFSTDEHDDFEASAEAIKHIEPILYRLALGLGKSKEDLVIYDPFYCRGGIRTTYDALKFKNFIHAKRDFYHDIDQGLIPDYDVLVTNPAYSGTHKERCLNFCFGSGKPFILLLPNYVANKDYYQSLLTSHLSSQKANMEGSSGGHICSPFYLVPHTKYEYIHPEGAGLHSSPFFSIWYVFLGQALTGKVFHWLEKKLTSGGGDPLGCRVVKTVGSVLFSLSSSSARIFSAAYSSFSFHPQLIDYANHTGQRTKGGGCGAKLEEAQPSAEEGGKKVEGEGEVSSRK